MADNGKGNGKHNGKRNFVVMTLKLVRAPEAKYSGNGNFYAKARGLLPMGKDKQSGDWRPGKFFDLVAFSKEEDTTLPEALAQTAKGDWVTVSGRLVYEEYAKQDGSTGAADKIIVQKIEAYTNGHDVDEAIEIDE
jgi:single-stranded DNA-binding protein